MSDPNKDPAELVKQAEEAIKAFKTSQKELETELKAQAKANGETSSKALEKAEKLAESLSGISAQILDLEQKMADNVKSGKASVETLGQMVIKSNAFKEYAQGSTSKMKVQANTIIGQEGSPLENSDTLVAPQRLAGIIPGSFRLLRIRDILPQGTTNSNAVEYVRELAFTNDAAETNEGVTKPESDITFELVTTPVKTIAHWLKSSKQVLDDAPALQSYIDTRLRYGVEYRIDAQILNGNGTNPNISGLTDSGNYTAFTAVTGENALDSINRAIYAVYAADYAPTAIVMNPADWGAIERLKVNAGTDDRYIVGNPTGILGPMLWGLPVIVSNAMTQGNFMVAAFDIAAQVWNRSGVVVEMFEQDEDNVQKNLLTIRAEARLAVAVYRPASIQYGGLTL
jgi:HK97 family phage major capsid protein